MSVLTPEFRVSFPAVFEAKENKMSGKMEYSLVALFAKGADLSKLKAAAQDAITEKWGTDQAKWPTGLRSPFRDQAEKVKNVDGRQIMPAGHEEGAIFMNLKSKQRPGVVDEGVQPMIDPSKFYAGCWARATINAYAYDQMGNKGVAFGLGNIQKVKDGDPFGNRTKPEDDFAAVEGALTESGGTEAATSLFD